MHEVEIADVQRPEVEMDPELRCASCEKFFKGKYQLKRHIKTVHDEAHAFSCTWCGMKFSRQDYMSKHLKAGLNENDEIKYRCEECDKIHCTLRSLQIHQS